MIKFEKTEVVGWEAAIRGMRNPMNSWEKSDSYATTCDTLQDCSACTFGDGSVQCKRQTRVAHQIPIIGPNDLALMKKLRNAGTDHRKFMRMIVVYVDVTAPLYWWKEFDTYKVGTVANSCSTMHKIADKEFELGDFSTEHLFDFDKDWDGGGVLLGNVFGDAIQVSPIGFINYNIQILNFYRNIYLETKDKTYWWQMIQLLPSSYNQKRTVMMSYEVLANIYKSRKNHKLDEWREGLLFKDGENGSSSEFVGLCGWIKSLPYSELITGDYNEDAK